MRDDPWPRHAPPLRPAPGAPPDPPPARGAADDPGRPPRLEGASDLELLEVLLRGQGRGGTARPAGAAAGLLSRFGTLRGLSTATADELARGARLSAPAAERLVAAFALGRRAQAVPLVRGESLRTTGQIFAAYGPLLRDLRKETLLALHLDAKGRVMREERVSEGTLTSSHAHPREVFGPALRHGTAGLILVHNHPSGDPEPSPEDLAATRRLAAVGDLVGIRLLDHVVLGDVAYVSLLERGEIP